MAMPGAVPAGTWLNPMTGPLFTDSVNSAGRLLPVLQLRSYFPVVWPTGMTTGFGVALSESGGAASATPPANDVTARTATTMASASEAARRAGRASTVGDGWFMTGRSW